MTPGIVIEPGREARAVSRPRAPGDAPGADVRGGRERAP
jgi:hypothetical protein